MSEEQDKKDTSSDKAEPPPVVSDNNKPTTGDSPERDSATSKAETKTGPKHSTSHPAHCKRKSGKHNSSRWGLIVLIVLGSLAAAGWYGYDQLTKTQQTFADIKQSQLALTEQNRDFEAALSARMQAMQEQQTELTEYIQVLRDKNQHLRKDWLLMEAEYLIQLANYRLLFERDINTAIAALESADVRLRDTGDPGILSVRKVIAEAVQALKQVPQADLAGISLTLSAVNKDIDKMPLATPDPKSKQSEQAQIKQESKDVASWSELPAAIWRDLKSLIVIRDHGAPVQPLLSPEERFFLIENLRLQIEQARLAMLSGQAKVYQERLTTATGWIEEHFDKEAALTKSTLDTLAQIQAEPIAPVIPDISVTYQALRNYRLGREPLPRVKAEESAPATKTQPPAEPVKSEPAAGAS